MLARCGGGSDPCAGGGLILLHKRTAGAEALPIWTSADPDFFSAPEAPCKEHKEPKQPKEPKELKEATLETYDADVIQATVDATCVLTLEEQAVGMRARRVHYKNCLLYTSPSPRDQRGSRMPSSA